MTAAILLVCAAVFLAFGAMDYTLTRSRLLQQLEQSMDFTADRLSRSLSTATWNLNQTMAVDILLSELQDKNIKAIQVFDAETGNLFVARERRPDGVIIAPQGPPHGAAFSETRAISNGEHTIGSVRIFVDDANVGKQVVHSLTMTFIKVLTTSTLLVLACFWVLRRIIVTPLKNMSAMAHEIAANRDYTLRIPHAGQTDEMGTLIDNFNSMLDTIQGHETKLKRHSEELEEEVERRTAELRETNRELASAMTAAAHANEAKSRFLANMSHEIRTPMNAVLGMCDVALGTELNMKQREYLEIINSSAHSLLSLINDVLDVSKIEAGKFELERIPFSIRQLFEEVSDMFLDRIGESGLEFIVDIGHEVPERVVSDPYRLKQVLVNLVANAFKFTSRGEIVLSVRTEYGSASGMTLLFSVRDTGIGIPPDAQKHIFEAFTQADGSTTRKYGGTGLGLSICQKIVHIMGGTIWLDSVEGMGATFYISMPVQLTEGDENGSLILPEGLAGTMALVVDDNSATRTVLRRFLNSFGLRAETAASGEEALVKTERARLAGEEYSLALVDWRLPGMNGLEAAQKLRDRQPELPIVLMTAYGRDRELSHFGRSDNNADFLVKPIKMSQLFDSILTLHGHAASPRPQDRDADYRPALAGLRVLLVEDNMINRKVATEILLSANVRVTCANNGRDALQSLKDDEFDIVLMDVQMPVMDGIEATGHIRNRLGLDALPIVAMTAHAMRGDREKCLASGMNDYVAKPIERKAFLDTLVRHSPTGRKTTEEPGAPATDGTPDDSGQPPLHALPLDTESGLLRLGNNTSVYAEILTDFQETQTIVPKRILEMIHQGKAHEAHGLAHSLKGAAGNISAYPVQNAADRLCKALGSPSGPAPRALEEQARELTRAMSDCSAAISAFLKDMPTTAPPVCPVPDRDAAQAIGSLAEHLRESDPVASQQQLLALRQADRAGNMKDALEQLERLIRSYDFDTALDVLTPLLHGLPRTGAQEDA